MRWLIGIAAVVMLLIAAAALYLFATVPEGAETLSFPPDARFAPLLARVPADADSWALVPRAAAFHSLLLEHPLTRKAAEGWVREQPVPEPWMLGGADLIAWRVGDDTSFAVRFDPVRRLLATIWTTLGGMHEGRWESGLLVFEHQPTSGSAPEVATMALSRGLPQGQALVVQRTSRRGDFPPIARPAVSSIQMMEREVRIVSRAAWSGGTVRELAPRFPADALLSAAFSDPPPVLRELRRVMGADLEPVTAQGGSITLYDVDAGTLLPRPRGLVSVPATPESRAALSRIGPAIALFGEVRETPSELLVAFDRQSAARYQAARFTDPAWTANRWAVQMDTRRLLPVLRRLESNPALRVLAPRLHRNVRNLNRWAGALESAERIEAASSAADGVEELRVRILAGTAAAGSK